MLENSGRVFRTSEKFVSAIKQYLCLSLLKNCSSNINQAVSLSCSIFLTLMFKFRSSLKAEIGVFFPMILLRVIEPATPGTTPNAAGGAFGFESSIYCTSRPCAPLVSGSQFMKLAINFTLGFAVYQRTRLNVSF